MSGNNRRIWATVQSLEGYYFGEHGVYGTTVKK